MKIMGLDASSSTVGHSIIEFDELTNSISLVYCDFLKPPKKGNLFNRLQDTQSMIKKILHDHKPDIIAIEDISKFMAGASTANTIITLAVFNRSVGLTCLEFLGRPPILCNVMSIRHNLKFNKVLPKKDEIPALVSKHLNIKFPFVYKKEKLIEENNDMADSIAVALYAKNRIISLREQITKLSEYNSLRIGPTITVAKSRTLVAQKNCNLLKQEYAELTGKEYGH